MKKFVTVLCCVALMLAVVPTSTWCVTAQGEGAVVNVKDFGAVGDGKTNDYAAMMKAFDYAITNYASKSIPVTVYFPEGEYGLLRGGMYVKLPFGSGNLTVKGAGADKSTIVYLEEWDNGGSWVALRIQLKQNPASEEDYMHDIVIQDLGVYDTNPVDHAWHPDKGDPGKEETHGFNIQHCVRATIKNCKVDNVGDEAIDMSHCIDSQMVDNLVLNSPGAGSAGGGISVGDGSKNVLIARNTSIGSIDASNKINWAIAVEALEEHIEGVVIEDNIISDINGYGINVGAPAGTIADVLIQRNTITDCSYGGVRLMGSGQTNGIKLWNNTITNGAIGIYLEGANKDGTVIENCTIDGTSSHGVKIDVPSCNDTLIYNTAILNSQYRAIYNAGTNTKIDQVLIDGVGLSGGVTVGAISQYKPSGTSSSCSEVTNTVILNCQNKYGTQNVQTVRNTWIQQAEISGYVSCAGASLIQNCKVNRLIQPKTGYTVEGVTMLAEADLGLHAVYLNNVTAYTITDCVFVLPSRYAIYENGTATNNTITNNVIIGGNGIKVIGADTVATGNVTGKVVEAETFRYRIVDGKATVMELLDTALTQVVIPATIDGYPVVAIDSWAFALCDKLTKVTIPESVTAIGANAFYWCDGLTDVYYTGNVPPLTAIVVGENNDALLNAVWHSPSDHYSADVAHSVMDTDNGNGLAFRFELSANNVSVNKGNNVNLTNATIDYLGEKVKLIAMGAVVTNKAAVGVANLTLAAVNGVNVVDIPTVYLQAVNDKGCVFATRIVDIPDTAVSCTIYARPYYIVEMDGEQVVVYGEVDAISCSEVLSRNLSIEEWYIENVQTALPEYLSNIEGASNLLTFTMMSDAHLRQNAPHIVDNVVASSAWANLVGNDFIMMSGDFIIGDLSKAESLALMDTAIEAAGSYGSVPVYAVKGNHDTNEDYKIGTDSETGKAVYSTADRITDEEFYTHAIAQSEATIVVDAANSYGGYYYVDFPKQKIRMICLNTTEDRDGVDILDSAKSDFRWSGVKSVAQLSWLANTALHVADGWAVMMVSHIPPITGADVGVGDETSADAPFHTRGIKAAALTELCEAFVSGGKGTVTAKAMVNGVVKNVTVSYDFSVQGEREFIGHFCGHVHEDSLSEYNGINYVVVNCTTPQKRWDTSLDREIGTETALSLNSFIINRETRTVECIKIGTGESYSFTW